VAVAGTDVAVGGAAVAVGSAGGEVGGKDGVTPPVLGAGVGAGAAHAESASAISTTSSALKCECIFAFMFESSLLFVSRAHADRIGEQFYGPPDLAVQVISPATQRTDRGDKFVEYARAGVSEYWLVDPEPRTIEVFVLEKDVYVLLGKFGAGETVRSQLLPGFQVTVDVVFAA
jgi:hypothetical protein